MERLFVLWRSEYLCIRIYRSIFLHHYPSSFKEFHRSRDGELKIVAEALQLGHEALKVPREAVQMAREAPKTAPEP